MTKKQQTEIPHTSHLKYPVYAMIFGAMIFRGAFFSAWLILLNICCLIFIISRPRQKAISFDLNFLFLIGLFLAAVLSALIVDTNAGIALEELLRYLLFPLSYIVFANIEDKKMVEAAFHRSFLLLAIGGLLAVAGLPLADYMVIDGSRRLQSFLQYANTTAMLLSAGVIMSAHYYMKTKSKSEILSGAIMLTALILTRSRIGIAVFIAVAAVYIFLCIKHRIRYYILAGFAAVLLAVFILWFELIISFVLGPTLVERLLTYIDALSELRSNFFGIGMGQWQFLHLQFQTAPYQVRYIHSVYFQIALDAGFLGLLSFLAVAICSLVTGFRRMLYHVFLLLVIITGSILEVNFAFGLVIIFFTFILSNLSLPKRTFALRPVVRLSLVLPTLALTLMLFSQAAITVGRLNQDDTGRAQAAFRVAHAANPWNYRIFMDMARVEPSPHEALRLLERGHLQNPVDREFIRELALGYGYVGDFDEALIYARMLFQIHRFSLESQGIYKSLLLGAYEAGHITSNEHYERLAGFRSEVEAVNAGINPLFRLIDPNMEYRR
ncbi:MAG: O-antigen ligase family protein [Oscillospiraceae bacterium]|nr:O-antigen ligase family protein [Oscillospiraceae bacterium]